VPSQEVKDYLVGLICCLDEEGMPYPVSYTHLTLPTSDLV